MRAVPSGRSFIRRLYDLTSGLQFPQQHVRLNNESKKDLLVWKFFLKNFNGTNIIKKINWSNDTDWNFYSDASCFGYAAIFGHKWVQGKFPTIWSTKSIAIKELVPIYLAFHLWAQLFPNTKILFHVDNASIVAILSSHTSRDSIIMNMVLDMVLLAMKFNIIFSAKHIRGKHNVISDCISRFQTEKARRLAPWLDEKPHSIPENIYPWNRV